MKPNHHVRRGFHPHLEGPKHFDKDYGPSAPTFIDLFCGCGGATLGMIAAGYNLLCGIDLSRDALETYQLNIGSAVMADVRYLPLRENLRPSVVWGSPPCQGFSRLNASRDKPHYATQRRLLLWFAQAIEYLQPKTVLFENIRDCERYPEFQDMVFFLKFQSLPIPYDVRYRVLDAADYGVPQHRRRLILVAIRNEKVIARLELPLPPYDFGEVPRPDLPENLDQTQLVEFAEAL